MKKTGNQEITNMNIKNQVVQYINHVENVEYLNLVLSTAGIETLLDCIVETLTGESYEEIFSTYLFIYDVKRFSLSRNHKDLYKKLYSSPVIEAIHRNVFSDNHFIRSASIQTLGKLRNRTSIPLLEEAFNRYKGNDPILIPDLITEMFWLQRKENWRIVEQLMRSQSYLSRWSVLEILDQASYKDPKNKKGFKRIKAYVERLWRDQNPLIRAEADYTYRELMFLESMELLTKANKRKGRHALNKIKPKITFSSVRFDFESYLYENHQYDYHVEEFEWFIDKLKSEEKKLIDVILTNYK
jgi:hypothetical protein